MKHIITLIAVAFTLSLGACCTTGGSCPTGAKKCCGSEACKAKGDKKCCGSEACKTKGAHKH
jgi:hypothetical protein